MRSRLTPFSKQSGGKWLVLGFAALMLFQLASTLLCFKTPRELFRPETIINVDWCSQYYWSFAARRFFETSGRIWGFDPYYMAGYPLDFIFNSSLPVQLSNIIFKWLPIGTVIKWFFLLSFMAVPLNFYFALKNFGIKSGAALAAAALGVSYFWLGEDALFGNWGMISGALLLNLFLLTASALFRFLKSGGRKSFAMFALLLALSILIHKTSLVLVGLPAAALVLVFARRMRGRARIGLLAAIVFALLVNGFWLMPMVHFLPNKIEDPATTFFQNTDLLRFLKDLVPWPFPGVALGRLAIIIPALFGMIRMRGKSESRDLYKFTALAAAGFFIFVYFGSLLPPLRNLQPYRYLTALLFLLTPAAGAGLEGLAEFAGRRAQTLARALPALFFALLLGLQFTPSFRMFYLVTPLTSQWPGKVTELRKWLEQNTDQNARIMIEDINKWEGRVAPYGPSRFVGLLPALLPRQLIGGPLPNAFIRHHYASFYDGRFLNRPIQDYDDRELLEKMDLYNLRWAVAWSPEAKARLNNFSYARKAASFDDLEVFEISRRPDWFLQGAGVLRADYDRIELMNLKPENGIVVLKMHWLDGFKANPGCEIYRHEAGGDPIGFIGLKNPASEVVLRYEH